MWGFHALTIEALEAPHSVAARIGISVGQFVLGLIGSGMRVHPYSFIRLASKGIERGYSRSGARLKPGGSLIQFGGPNA